MNATGLIEPKTIYTIIAEPQHTNIRIDRFCAQQFPSYSRSFFQQLIDEGHITLNGKVIKQSAIVAPNNVIEVKIPAYQPITPEKIVEKTIGISIIYKHEHFMIIYKPAGLLVHAPSTTSTAITVVDWIQQNHAEINNIGSIDRPGIVHRLDKDTSGILIISRTNHAHGVFGSLFRQRAISKTYHALVQGHPPQEGTIDLPIGRDPRNRSKMSAFSNMHTSETQKTNGIKIRPAQTHYKVIEYFDKEALVEVKPITGRTHQIRVHMAAIGHPIIGDSVYGTKSPLINRQALHAYGVSFTFDNESHVFTHEIPKDMQQLITILRLETTL